eukprot:TRINITY_DN14450_c0_g1_i6.p1 TRINITY_DN14450_c0_g1~~TRINITY_DN14450_c0_g1_i6.p1  ORF type:complete len:142 (+),score=41.00 TRINITY_DN14450_c0_g1_i6:49-474(+)
MDMFWFVRHFGCCLGRDKADDVSPAALETRRPDDEIPGLTSAASVVEAKLLQERDEDASSTQETCSRRSSLGTEEDTDDDMPTLVPAPKELPPSSEPTVAPKANNAKLALFKQSVSARALGAPAGASTVRSRLAAMQEARR